MSKQESSERDETDPKDPNIDFLQEQSDSILNHLVRQDEELKGSLKISVREDGKYDITLYEGTSDKPRTIESIDKNDLIKMIKKNL